MSEPVPVASEPLEPAPLPRAQTRRLAVVAVAIAGLAFLALTYGRIGENLVYYWGPSELHAAGGKAIGATIRLGGHVMAGSVRRGEGVSGVEFDVSDGKEQVHVHSSSVPPQMFREGIAVVVEGTMTRAGQFESQRLMVSHDNKYEAEGDHPKDVKEMMRRAQEAAEAGER